MSGGKFTYSDRLKPAGMSEIAGKISADGHASENKESNGAAVTTHDAENTSNESETKEPRYVLPFCLVFGLGSLFSSTLATYISSQVTMLERTLGLSSTESGMLLSANDLGFAVTVLIASHFLHRSHIPRILAGCVLVFGLSGVLTGVSHFFIDEKMPSHDPSSANSSSEDKSNYICIGDRNNLTTMVDCDTNGEGSTESFADRKWVFGYIGFWMIVQGIVKAPRNPLAATYVDNNAKKERTAFYLGILNTLAIFGPMIAITAGGVFSKLPVDLKDTSLEPEDPRWVGAWWLGFLVFGLCAVLISLPVFCFPGGPKSPMFNKNKSDNKSIDSDTQNTFCAYIKDLPKSVFRVICCPVYTLCVIGAALQSYAALSLLAFGPKYIENQFNIPSWKANLIIGPEKLGTMVLGVFGGGLISRKLNLDTTGLVKLVLFSRTITIVLNCFNFLFGCDNPPMVGLDTTERINTNLTCDCSSTNYMPVCADGQTFFSPCYAGCQLQTETGFSQCLDSTSGDVTKGFCDPGCVYLIPFVITDGLGSLIDALVVAPNFVIILRSVRERDRTMGTGLTAFLISLAVMLPAPIIYGILFDSLCLAWKNECGEEGSCSLYDVADMRVTVNAINVGVRFACLLSTLLMLYCAKRLLNVETPHFEETAMEASSEIQHKIENGTAKQSKEFSTHEENSKGHDIMHTHM